MIIHYDLFAGIGGNSIALEEVFKGETIEHIFCEWEAFPTAVLKKHWPEAEYWGDIADLVTHTSSKRLQRSEQHGPYQEGSRPQGTTGKHFTVVTGGFPCQPFSHAGRRKGTADHRYQWPNMFQVIRNVAPEWVVAENVRGLVTWNDGMVLEQVCSDLESEGYEVQPFIIPAVAVNAPHRRDRVWIIAHRNDERATAGYREVQKADGEISERNNDAELSNADRHATGNPEHNGRNGSQDRQGDTKGNDSHQTRQEQTKQLARPSVSGSGHAYPDWSRNWQEVAFATCNDTVDDGLPRIMDGVTISRAKWRQGSLKAYGNAIVPQVAMQIFKAIKATV